MLLFQGLNDGIVHCRTPSEQDNPQRNGLAAFLTQNAEPLLSEKGTFLALDIFSWPSSPSEFFVGFDLISIQAYFKIALNTSMNQFGF